MSNDELKLNIPGATVRLIRDFLDSPPTVAEVLEDITLNTEEESMVRIHGRYIPIPRKQTAYGDPGTFYRFSGNRVVARSWSESVLVESIKLELEAEELVEEEFNFVLVNFYENGKNTIGWHSDDEKDLRKNSTIASLTLGAERDFLFKEKATGKLHRISLPHNSLLLMSGDTQKNYLHSLPKRLRVVEPRFNFTFRQMKV